MFFGKNPSRQTLNAVERLCVESMSIVSGVGSKSMSFDAISPNWGGEYQFFDPSSRKAFLKRTDEISSDLSNRDPDSWPNRLAQSWVTPSPELSQKELKEAAAVLIVQACTKLNMVAMVWEEYPKSKKLGQMLRMCFESLAVSMSVIFPGRCAKGPLFPVVTQKFGSVEIATVDADSILTKFPNLKKYHSFYFSL